MSWMEFVFRVTGSGHLHRETNLDLEGLFYEKLKAVWAEYELNLESNGINLVKNVHRPLAGNSNEGHLATVLFSSKEHTSY